VQVHGQSQPTATKKFRNLLCYTAKVLVLFLKLFFFSTVLSFYSVRKCFLYLRIVDIMLIISVIAVRLHTHLNVDFYGRFTPAGRDFFHSPRPFLPPWHFDLIANI